MRVTLIRHGEAGDDARRDEDRALTRKGRADVRRVGRALSRHGARFGAIVTSPLVRAVQTAEIIAAKGDYRGRVTVDQGLIPDAPPDGIKRLLAALADCKSVALVAHEPILSRIAALLLGQPEFPALRKAEAVRIRLEAGAGSPATVRWRIDPGDGKRHKE
jgi:phosphohistidine phosphatase